MIQIMTIIEEKNGKIIFNGCIKTEETDQMGIPIKINLEKEKDYRVIITDESH